MRIWKTEKAQNRLKTAEKIQEYIESLDGVELSAPITQAKKTGYSTNVFEIILDHKTEQYYPKNGYREKKGYKLLVNLRSVIGQITRYLKQHQSVSSYEITSKPQPVRDENVEDLYDQNRYHIDVYLA